MKKITLVVNAALFAQLGLNDSADEAAVGEAINNMAAKAKQAETLQNTVNTQKTEIVRLENELGNVHKAAKTQQIDNMLADASKAGKITNEAVTTFKAQFEDNPDGLKAVLDTMKPYKPVTTQIENNGEGGGNNPATTRELKAAYDKAFEEGTLADVKDSNPDQYKAMYKAKFGIDPK